MKRTWRRTIALFAEECRETRRGGEYILREPTGETMAIVQLLGRKEEIYLSGTDASLIHGPRGYHRVVPAWNAAERSDSLSPAVSAQ